jgi:hypothetical protein
MKKLNQVEHRECLLPFGPEFSGFHFIVQEHYNLFFLFCVGMNTVPLTVINIE